MATYTAPNYPSSLKKGDIINFPYTGAAQTLPFSVGSILQLEVWGAEGGNRGSSSGGKGGYAKGQMTISSNESLVVCVGGMGNATAKGWNGGGAAGYSGVYGGGATDIRRGGTSLSNRVLVAGGGGSVGAPTMLGGAGGGTTGVDATGGYGTGGQGGTQTAGGAGYSSYSATAGSLGQGGKGYYYADGYGGGGGGGYYGGAGTYPDGSGDDDRGGGGGSSYINGVTDGLTITGNNAMPSPTSSSTQTGQSGNGYARITILDLITPQEIKTGDVFNYSFTGASSFFIPNKEAKIRIEVWGAEGGNRGSSASGGKGGYSKGEITIEKEETLMIYVGGMGNSTGKGWNGGGVGAYSNVYGGGATDVRRGGSSLSSRIIVAGGGGSVGAANKPGGAGGGTTGISCTENYGTGGQGGTQTAGGEGSSSNTSTAGSLGQGGKGISHAGGYGGAGGGGYYGGAGSHPDGSGDDDRGGGGGSGYIGGVTSGTTIAGNTSMPSPTSGTQTGQSGNGYARITVLEVAGPTELKKGDILTYDFTGRGRTLIPDKDVTIRIEVWGAEGGNRSGSAYGGKGGYAKGEIALKKDEVIMINVGGMGDSISKGWNGGGSSGLSSVYGGGATDVRKGGTALSNRIIVAGGGGSVGAADKPGGAGGGTSGESRTESYGSGGQGGTQSSGGAGSSSSSATAGSLGQGGKGISASSGYGGAGGGGYYGGAGSHPDSSGDDDRGGGGGSGYVSSILSNSQLITGNTTMPSPTSTSTQTGQSGNGYCKITVLSVNGVSVRLKIGDSWQASKAIKVRKNNEWIEAKAIKVFKNGVWEDAKT